MASTICFRSIIRVPLGLGPSASRIHRLKTYFLPLRFNDAANLTRETTSRNICTSGRLQFSVCQNLLYATKQNETSSDNQNTPADSNQKSTEEEKIEKEYLEKITLLSKDIEELKDKYQRALADRENVRQRLEKQITDSKLYGIQSFCKDLLEVSDVFRKAIESVPQEKVKGADPIFVGLYDGVVMTEKQLLAVFRRHGLSRIIPQEGDKFDPSIQEAVFEAPLIEGKEPGTVAHVIRTGWKLHDRCVRSAQVGVTKS